MCIFSAENVRATFLQCTTRLFERASACVSMVNGASLSSVRSGRRREKVAPVATVAGASSL